MATDHKPATAYLIFREIVEGSNSKLNPTATLNRAQAAAMILRVKAEEADIKTPPGAPTNLAVLATPAPRSTSPTIRPRSSTWATTPRRR